LRILVAALLIAVPLALVSWVVRSGSGPPRQPSTAAVQKPPEGGDPALRGLFDSLPPGAQLKGPVVLYDEKTLFDYIDGAAPLYIQRHFRRLAAVEMAAGGGELTADVYDMAVPANAASIFAAERSLSAKGVAGFDAAAAGPMSLVFQQGRYYVKLTAFDAKGEAALPELARALAKRMR
jgi:hypothetical protein